MIAKVLSLLKSIKNPNLFKYRVCHALRHFVSYKKAARIAKENQNDYIKDGLREFYLPTYDGSNQSVHPDIIVDKEETYLVVTPYPYGMEEYENPCVYIGSDLKSFEKLNEAPQPIAFPRAHRPGIHLSDPVLVLHKNNLRCVYRESIRKKDGEENVLSYSDYIDGKWSTSQIIISSCEDCLISPAVLSDSDGNLFMFHVNVLSDDNSLILSHFTEDMKIADSSVVSCNGIPEGYRLWHISVYFENLTKKDDLSSSMVGLFTIKNYGNSGDPFKLFYAKGNIVDGWTLQKEVYVDEEIKRAAKFVYKSTFIPNTDKILLSFRDLQDRYRLIEIDKSNRQNDKQGDEE